MQALQCIEEPFPTTPTADGRRLPPIILDTAHRVEVSKTNVCATNIGPDLVHTAEKMLCGQLGLDPAQVRNPSTLTAALDRQQRLALFCPMRQKEYLKHFASAYCLALLMEEHELGPHLQKGLAAARGLTGKAVLDPVRVALESRIDYGGSSEDERRQGRVKRSRDIRALKHVRSRNLQPYEIILLARKKGEGIDQWHRNHIAASRFTAKPTPAQPTLEIAAAPSTKEMFVIRLVRQDGCIPPNEAVIHTTFLADGVSAETIERIRSGIETLTATVLDNQSGQQDPHAESCHRDDLSNYLGIAP